MRSLQISGKNYEAALNAALTQLCLSEEDVVVEVIEEGSKGFLGLGSKEAIINVKEKFNPAREGQQFLNDIFKIMDIEIEIECTDKLNDKGIVVYNLSGENVALLIGYRGQTLDSLQFLLNLYLNKNMDRKVRSFIDVESYREKREKTLNNLALRLAAKVAKNRRKIVLEPMNPQERRLIHLALQDDTRVRTYSEGEEPYRRVVVVPK